MPSTVIKHFEYLEAEKQLRVVFKTGKIYAYKEVPLDVYLAMRNSFAKGIYFNEHVKDKYPFERL